jgi:prepilin-type processing-associated H-X9-DG protein
MHLGRDLAMPKPLYWVGFIEKVGASGSLLCMKGDTSQADAVPGRNPLPENQDDDAALPPPDISAGVDQDVAAMDPPPSVKIGSGGALESNTQIREFREQKNATLSSSIKVNIAGPGYYDSYAKMTGGSVDAGTRVNCYFLHFDPVGSSGAEVCGSMNFTGEIVGVICRDAELDASDATLGNPGTVYPTGTRSRGFENSGQEIVTVSDDRHTLIVNRLYSTSVGEQMRVLVRLPGPDETGGSGGSGGGSSLAWDDEEAEDYGVGGPTSYAMNGRISSADVWPGQVLLLEYRRAVADVGLDGTVGHDNLPANLAARHMGRVNVLFADGAVRSLDPGDLIPGPGGYPWTGKSGK